MIITKAKIQNYKSFLDSDEIIFTPGFNVIVGKNNSGKTALIEALSLNFTDNAHISKATKPDIDSPIRNQHSSVIFNIEAQKDEVMNIFAQRDQHFQIPKSKSIREAEAINNFDEILLNGTLNFRYTFRPSAPAKAFLLPFWDHKTDNHFRYKITSSFSKPELLVDQIFGEDPNLDMANVVTNVYKERIYFFVAERYKVGQSPAGSRNTLEPDASNLPEPLLNLRATDSHSFDLILRHMGDIFNDINDIVIEIIDDTPTAKIFYSPYASEERRDDLKIPFQDSGSGFGQVLAFLYVVITSNNPQTFIIDEPQSFLHPGAVRKLFDILQKYYSQHQYIITTHSPAAISAANPHNIIHLIKNEEQTIAKNIDINESTEMRVVLGDVGARLSDVFGADSILWVEGKTEEDCFKEIVRNSCDNSLFGTAILGVIHTGDFETKKTKQAETIIRIYERLCEGPALVPPAIGFIFDREGRSDEEIKKLEKRGKGLIHFIPRRMYENYLLHPQAIANFIASIDDFSDKEVKFDDINKWFSKNSLSSDYHDDSNNGIEISKDNWITYIHGANFLNDLFRFLSNEKHRYDDNKIQYGLEITKQILAIAPEEFDELADLIDTILDKSNIKE